MHLVKKGKYAGEEMVATHYTLGAVVGAKLDLKDHGESLKRSNACNKYGIDGFNAAAMIDWVTRLYEEGVVKKEQVGGRRIAKKDRDLTSLLLLKLPTGMGSAISWRMGGLLFQILSEEMPQKNTIKATESPKAQSPFIRYERQN